MLVIVLGAALHATRLEVASVSAELREARTEVAGQEQRLSRALLQLEALTDANLASDSRRRLLVTTTGADALGHTSSDGSTALAVSSDVAVDVESVRFTSANIGVAADTDLVALASGTVTVNGDLAVTGALTEGTKVFVLGTGAITSTHTSTGATVVTASSVTSGGASVSNAGIWSVPTNAYYRVSGRLNFYISTSGEQNRYVGLEFYDIGNSVQLAIDHDSVEYMYAGNNYGNALLNVILSLSSTSTYKFTAKWDTNGATPTIHTGDTVNDFSIVYVADL